MWKSSFYGHRNQQELQWMAMMQMQNLLGMWWVTWGLEDGFNKQVEWANQWRCENQSWGLLQRTKGDMKVARPSGSGDWRVWEKTVAFTRECGWGSSVLENHVSLWANEEEIKERGRLCRDFAYFWSWVPQGCMGVSED